MEPKMGKRIVSRGAYFKAQGKRGALTGAAIVLWLLTLSFGLVTVRCLFFTVFGSLFITAFGLSDGDDTSVSSVRAYCLLAGIGGLGMFSFGLLAWNTTKATLATLAIDPGVPLTRANTAAIDPGVPLTRANTADLPALESLVRASAEPMQAQEAVLLRAAVESVERHEEQLVRASMGGKE